MTYKELREITKHIDLKSLGFYLGEKADKAESVSCFEENGEWVFLRVDDRQNELERRGSEEDIVRKMYGRITLVCDLEK